jgi:glutamyl/glutaminyl-tRNA synthetase
MDPNLARADHENAAILATDSAQRVLAELHTRIRSKAGPISAADFNAWMNDIKNTTGIPENDLYPPVRVAITGTNSGPDFDKLIAVLEQGATLNIGIPSVGQRLAAFISN